MLWVGYNSELATKYLDGLRPVTKSAVIGSGELPPSIGHLGGEEPMVKPT